MDVQEITSLFIRQVVEETAELIIGIKGLEGWKKENILDLIDMDSLISDPIIVKSSSISLPIKSRSITEDGNRCVWIHGPKHKKYAGERCTRSRQPKNWERLMRQKEKGELDLEQLRVLGQPGMEERAKEVCGIHLRTHLGIYRSPVPKGSRSQKSPQYSNSPTVLGSPKLNSTEHEIVIDVQEHPISKLLYDDEGNIYEIDNGEPKLTNKKIDKESGQIIDE